MTLFCHDIIISLSIMCPVSVFMFACSWC